MHEWLARIDRHFPVRYTAWALSAVLALLMVFCWVAFGFGGGWALLFLFLTGLGLRDVRQARHSVLRNYPVIGHVRFLLEFWRQHPPVALGLSWHQFLSLALFGLAGGTWFVRAGRAARASV